jgi:hypothetical protein
LKARIITWKACAKSTWTTSDFIFLVMLRVLVILEKQFKTPLNVVASSVGPFDLRVRVDSYRIYPRKQVIRVIDAFNHLHVYQKSFGENAHYFKWQQYWQLTYSSGVFWKILQDDFELPLRLIKYLQIILIMRRRISSLAWLNNFNSYIKQQHIN